MKKYDVTVNVNPDGVEVIVAPRPWWKDLRPRRKRPPPEFTDKMQQALDRFHDANETERKGRIPDDQ